MPATVSRSPLSRPDPTNRDSYREDELRLRGARMTFRYDKPTLNPRAPTSKPESK